ncbi:MAG: dihydroorotate dehydrogenase electron transfer subunit [bacterium]|nr:MAG: dihydroorotate dehydrogenase electron transfer subunit [bacterium]
MTAGHDDRHCAAPSPSALMEAEVLTNTEVAAGLWRLRLGMPQWSRSEPSPGQFVMVRVSDDGDPLLGRPFGIAGFWLHGPTAEMEIIFRVVGKGTGFMTRWSSGSPVRLLGPLGNGFPLPPLGSRCILVAGGVGLPPLLALARSLESGGRGGDVLLLYGEANRDRMLDLDTLPDLGVRFATCTEDGSCGREGLVTDLLAAAEIGEDSLVYACGPAPMMRAVHERVSGRCLDSFYSLESRMACGFGVCAGCAVEVREGDEWTYVRVCSEGPVFSGDLLTERSFRQA